MVEKQASVIASFVNQIRRDIALGVLPPGQRLVIEQLKREHKISHPSVREALSQLLGEGYVTFEGQKGFKVREASIEVLRDITRVRSELEVLAVGWSIENSTIDWRAAVTAAHFALTEVEKEMVEDPVNYALEWDERNRNFHMTLCSNCGSDQLVSLIAQQYDLTRRYRLMPHKKGEPIDSRASWMGEDAREHQALKDAVLASDIDTAVKLLKTHINKGAKVELFSVFADEEVDKKGSSRIAER